MAIVNGWLDWATRIPGPEEKLYSQPNSVQGYVPHSAVGFYGGWQSRLFDMSRNPPGHERAGLFTDYAAASVTGWIAYDGSVIQHYPLTASCWASGNLHANTNFVAFENEGGLSPYDEPLKPAQVSANIRIIQELSAWKGWEPKRPMNAQDKTATLYEHNECVARWGGFATACPSSRIPWTVILDAIEEDNMVARMIKIEGDRPSHKTYLWRPGRELLRMTSETHRVQTAELYGISPTPITVKRNTVDTL